ncbi:hypothetical protein KL86DYS2_12804 [uncultured Dysgonomonas sp.]|uniref:Uncharacterized protein n=1 Tax=uncultured Dysgonomonas sp. TaxID=206096 RepID=A0A212K1C6_9BACT|nr:hypothetical protein [uncultured Dysgonomonas sp.]SBW05511.1 hypothetical protein KL86DYS2_12804 [uncultured Dysgonomonas sp.]
MAKKKKRGHYCRICGASKPNEAFSGKGHAKHICKECSSLSQERKNELQHINQIDRIAGKYPRSRPDWEFLEKMSKNKKYPEAAEFAQMILGVSRSQSDSDDEENELFGDWGQGKLSYSEFDEFAQGDIMSMIEDDIWDWISYGNGELPDEKSKQQILKDICKNIAFGNGDSLIQDDELNNLFDSILKKVVADLEEELEEDL